MFANIIVNKKAVRNRSFTYRIPKELGVKPGSLVLVPFRGKRIAGVVESISKARPKIKTKTIESLIYPTALLPFLHLKLASFIAKKYYAPYAAVIFDMLPNYLKRIKRGETLAKVTRNSKLVTSKKAKQYPQLPVISHQSSKRYLLHDPEGNQSLKIYQKAIKDNLKKGKQILFFVPDLGLPIVEKIKRLSAQSIVLDSTKSEKEGFKEWLEAKFGKYNLIIGSHLALFAPLKNIGLIIVHHEDDSMYKNEQTPKYHLREVAKELARLSKATIILQSQLPSLESYLGVVRKKFKLLKFGSRRRNSPKIIDLRAEKGLISLELEKKLEDNLKNGKRTLLFLNRRGFSRFFTCLDCGYGEHKGAQDPITSICPKCRGSKTKEHSFGTQRLEYEMQQRYQKARTLRIDKDFAENHQELSREIEKSQIVIATSYIFKLEFKIFDTTALILTEIGLSLPDFRNREQLFRTLNRALSLGKEKIVQTFYPHEPLLVQSYQEFIQDELELRKTENYPPFSTLIRLTLEDQEKNGSKIQKKAKSLAKDLQKLNQTYPTQTEILGPAPVFIPKRDKIKLEIILKGKNPYPLLSLVPNMWKVEVDPVDVLR